MPVGRLGAAVLRHRWRAWSSHVGVAGGLHVGQSDSATTQWCVGSRATIAEWRQRRPLKPGVESSRIKSNQVESSTEVRGGIRMYIVSSINEYKGGRSLA